MFHYLLNYRKEYVWFVCFFLFYYGNSLTHTKGDEAQVTIPKPGMTHLLSTHPTPGQTAVVKDDIRHQPEGGVRVSKKDSFSFNKTRTPLSYLKKMNNNSSAPSNIQSVLKFPVFCLGFFFVLQLVLNQGPY